MTKEKAIELMKYEANCLKEVGGYRLTTNRTLYDFVLAWSLAEIIDNEQFIELTHMVDELVKDIYKGGANEKIK